MSRVRSETLSRLDLRMCLRCGYAGAEVQRTSAVETFTCPACHADLYARPARSYAEMEGLAPLSPRAADAADDDLLLDEAAPDTPRDRRGLMWRLGRFLARLLPRRRERR